MCFDLCSGSHAVDEGHRLEEYVTDSLVDWELRPTACVTIFHFLIPCLTPFSLSELRTCICRHPSVRTSLKRCKTFEGDEFGREDDGGVNFACVVMHCQFDFSFVHPRFFQVGQIDGCTTEEVIADDDLSEVTFCIVTKVGI